MDQPVIPTTPDEVPHPGDNTDIRQRLLQAGLTEFAHFGFQGARLSRVAASAGCAKRMIYYYFNDKNGFYLAVLGEAYAGIRQAETDLDLDTLEPMAALHRLAIHSFDYHEANLDFTRLVLVENLQQGRMMEHLGQEAERLRAAAIQPLTGLLARGAAAGVFRDGLDAGLVHYLISAHSSYRCDHAGTWKKLLRIDLLSPESRKVHLDMLLVSLDRLVRPDGATDGA